MNNFIMLLITVINFASFFALVVNVGKVAKAIDEISKQIKDISLRQSRRNHYE